MILSDRDIKSYVNHGDLKIEPYDPKFVQPASYDLHLSRWFRSFVYGPDRPIDPKIDSCETKLYEKQTWRLEAAQFVLASTIQRVSIPSNLVGRLEGKSSLGRLGLLVHSTAGFLDPGFNGHITLEIRNLNMRPIILHAGMPIGQLSIEFLTVAAESPYGTVEGSKYQDQGEAPVESKYWKNFPDKFLESS